MLVGNVFRPQSKYVSVPILFIPELKIRYLNIHLDGLSNTRNLIRIYVYSDQSESCIVLDGKFGTKKNSKKYLLDGAIDSVPDEIFLKDLNEQLRAVYEVGSSVVSGKRTNIVIPSNLFLPALAGNLNACIFLCAPLFYRGEKIASQLIFVDADACIRKPILSAGITSIGDPGGADHTAKKLFLRGEYRKDSAFILSAQYLPKDYITFYMHSALKHFDLHLETPFPENHPLIIDYKFDKFPFNSGTHLYNFNLLQDTYYVFSEILATGSLFLSYCINSLVLSLIKIGFYSIKNATVLQKFFNELVDSVCNASGVDKSNRQVVFRTLLKTVPFLCDAGIGGVWPYLMDTPDILLTDNYFIVARDGENGSEERCSYASPLSYLVLDLDLNDTPLSYDLTKYVCTVLYGKEVVNTVGNGLVFVG